MGRKGLLLLLAAVLLLGVGYFWIGQDRSASEPVQREVLLPGLQGKLGEVQAIEIERAGEPSLRVERVDSVWQVPAKAGYRADAQELGQTLRALAEARKVEARTANPAYHARLGLADQGSPGEQGVRVRLELADSPAPVELKIGSAGSRSGQLVRMGGDEQVWLIDRNIPLPASELAWLDQRVTQIPFGQIRQVEVRHGDGERLRVWRESGDQPNLQVEQLPTDRQLAYEASANGMATLFGDLRFIDALPLAQLQFEEQPVLRFELLTFDDGRLQGELYRRAEHYWLLLPERAGLTGEQVPAAADWAFQIDETHYRALARRLADMLGEP